MGQRRRSSKNFQRQTKADVSVNKWNATNYKDTIISFVQEHNNFIFDTLVVIIYSFININLPGRKNIVNISVTEIISIVQIILFTVDIFFDKLFFKYFKYKHEFLSLGFFTHSFVFNNSEFLFQSVVMHLTIGQPIEFLLGRKIYLAIYFIGMFFTSMVTRRFHLPYSKCRITFTTFMGAFSCILFVKLVALIPQLGALERIIILISVFIEMKATLKNVPLPEAREYVILGFAIGFLIAVYRYNTRPIPYYAYIFEEELQISKASFILFPMYIIKFRLCALAKEYYGEPLSRWTVNSTASVYSICMCFCIYYSLSVTEAFFYFMILFMLILFATFVWFCYILKGKEKQEEQ